MLLNNRHLGDMWNIVIVILMLSMNYNYLPHMGTRLMKWFLQDSNNQQHMHLPMMNHYHMYSFEDIVNMRNQNTYLLMVDRYLLDMEIGWLIVYLQDNNNLLDISYLVWNQHYNNNQVDR
jgi:hypothetical protein